MNHLFKQIFYFYIDGFRQMTIGKKLWLIILAKLFILFVVFKVFFFHNFLKSKFNTEKAKSDYVIEQLTR